MVHWDPPPPPLRNWQRPSLSSHAPTHLIELGAVSRVGPDPQTRIQQLFSARILGNMETRVRFTPTSLAELQAQVEERMLGARGDSRWKDLSSRWKQFMAWSILMDEEGAEALAMEWRICNFLEMKLRSQPPNRLAPASAIKYATDLSMCVNKTSHTKVDEMTMSEYVAALKRMGTKPEAQAPPASLAQVILALGYLSESEAVGLMLAWLTASRIGELEHLLKEHLRPYLESSADPPPWVIEFPYHKGDPFRLGTVNTIFLGAWGPRITRHLESLRPGQKVTTLTTVLAATVMSQVDSALSAHSVKRGALVALLRAGIPLAVIQAFAKHKDLETLYIYLPRAEVALHLGMHDASRSLGLYP